MSDVLNVLTSIENYLVDLPAKILLKADQIYIVNGLSDVSENLGIITAGEFRAGNRLDPGRLFSGMRMAYPPMVYDLSGIPTNWNLVGIDADVLQFGVRASDGKLVAGGGAVILDDTGITAVGGTIAGWTIDTTELTNTKIKISSAGSIESIPFVSGIGGSGWKISEDGDVEFNNAVIRGELRTTVLTYQEVQAVAGTMGVFHSAGVLSDDLTLPAVPAGNYTIKTKAPNSTNPQIFGNNHILHIKNGTQSTWFEIDGGFGTSGDGYSWVCTYLSGTTDVTYTIGQAVISYGVSGDGFLLMEAIGTGAPYFSVRTHAGAPYTTTTEHVRMGNLNGNWGYASGKYGVAIGQYATDKPNIILDEDGALTINIFDGTTNNTVLQFDDSGSFITNILNMSGASAAIAIGTTPPTGSTTGTGIWIDKTGLFSLDTGTYQVKIDATDGKLYAGGGDVILDEDGLTLTSYTSTTPPVIPVLDTNTIRWNSGATEVATITVEDYTVSDFGKLSIEVGGRTDNIISLLAEYDGIHNGIMLGNSLYSIGRVSYWNSIQESPVYVSSTQVKFEGVNLSSILTVGMKVKFTQTTVKYFYITEVSYASSDTTITLYGGGTYTVADATVNNFHFSGAAVANAMPFGSSTFIPLTTPLTSTSYDGGDTVAVGTTSIDTSTVFGAPAGIKAALIFFRAKWASASVNNFMYVRPVGATRYVGIIYAYSTAHYTESVIVPCDSNGDFEFVVGGANATEVICEIWGYWI